MTSPGATSRVFVHERYSGYIGFPIPDWNDARVLEVIQSTDLRAELVPEDVSVLAVFGHRWAIAAVRRDSVEQLELGFLAVAIAFDLDGDYRDAAMSMPALWHSAGLLGVTADHVESFLARNAVSPATVSSVGRYAEADHLFDLSYMGWAPRGRGSRFDYVRVRGGRPPLPGHGRASARAGITLVWANWALQTVSSFAVAWLVVGAVAGAERTTGSSLLVLGLVLASVGSQLLVFRAKKRTP